MFLLNHVTVLLTFTPSSSLHSTMFLLNPPILFLAVPPVLSLHSTMFLLNLLPHRLAAPVSDSFTFHDVSIKSMICARAGYSRLSTLHSTMFLLNRDTCFADVLSLLTLHSTMFLLNRLTRCSELSTHFLYIPRCFY